MLALALLATLPGLAAAAAPPPLDVGATRILSAQYFENYAGKFLVVKARDRGASSLAVSWFDQGSSSATGAKAMSRRSDAGVYLYDSALVPVAARPDHVVVTRNGNNHSRAPVTDWATGGESRPFGYQSDFQTGYVTPAAANQRIESLASTFPEIASPVDLPLKTNGYRRRAQTIVGASATGSNAPQAGAAANAAVVLTSAAYGHEGGNTVGVWLGLPLTDPTNAPLSVSVVSNLVYVSLATNASAQVTSTAAQVVAAINASPAAAALLEATTYRGNAGAGIVTPTDGIVPLSDGLTAPIGESREPRTVRALRIGKVRDGSKPGVLITAWTNGRDRVTPLVALELSERLLRNYATDPVTNGLVDNLDIFVVPAVNPDGATYATYDNPDQGKNMTSHCPAAGAADPAARNLWGVNIGRNFSVGSFFDGFAGGSIGCADAAFSGPSELSEPETYNVAWLLSNFPNLKFAADLQASGGSVTWSPGAYKAAGRETLPAPAYGVRQYFAALAGRIAADTAHERGTVLLPTEVGAATDVHGSAAGNLLDEAYYNHGIFALGIDVGADHLAADGGRTPVGTAPDFNSEGHSEVLEFTDGLHGLLAAALDWARDTTPPQVTADPPAGSYAVPLGIRFQADEPATIHYTLDGSTPTLASPAYRPATPLDVVEPVQITATTTVKWIAADAKGNVSAVRSAEYRKLPPPAPPTTPAPPGPTNRPLLTGLRASARCVGPGRDVYVNYTLAAPARIALTLQRRLAPRGSRPPAVCPKKPKTPSSGQVRYSNRIPFQPRPRPLPPRRVSRTLTPAAGTYRIALLKTLRAPRLAPGAYRVVLRAQAGDGSGSQTETIELHVLRPR